MAGIEPWECQVLRDQAEKLELALTPELLFVAQEMNKDYLLSDSELSEIQTLGVITDAQRVVKIVSALKRMVNLNTANFEKFVTILKKKPEFFESIISCLSKPVVSPQGERSTGMKPSNYYVVQIQDREIRL